MNRHYLFKPAYYTISASEESDEACVGPITPKEAFSLENRPFLSFVFEALDCSENDYLVLFGLCLLRAIQGNEGETIWLVRIMA